MKCYGNPEEGVGTTQACLEGCPEKGLWSQAQRDSGVGQKAKAGSGDGCRGHAGR